MGDADSRWQQRYANDRRALAQLLTFFEPPALNERERQTLRDVLRQAFRAGLIVDGECWMRMIQDRNLTSHTYNPATADQISANIRSSCRRCFEALDQVLQARLERDSATPP